MLDFFRKYQKYIFLVTTVAIVLSFVFFGAAQVIFPVFFSKGPKEKSYLAQMQDFLDTEQWMISRKIFAANFLNDGVISKEILDCPIGNLLAKRFEERFHNDFADRFEKEKKYRTYVHPFLPSLSAEGLWAIFAPDLPLKLKAHVEGKNAFETRSALFLAQKQFPPAFLSQIVRYQEQKSQKYDPKLFKEDIYLFGYHSLSDWFGPEYVELCARLIIESANMARKQGMKVTQEELRVDLVARAEEVFRALKDKIDLPVQDGYGLFQLYLSQTALSEERALKIWEDVTLFRRLFHSVGDAALNDTLGFSDFYSYAYESALVEVVQVPRLHLLQSNEDLKKLETYFALCGERRSSVLDIPLNYAPLHVVEAQAPDFVGRRYCVDYAVVSKSALEARVGLRQMVEWECDAKNWPLLQGAFSFLLQKSPSLETLESLNEKERKLVDGFACRQIAAGHSEWLEEALLEKELVETDLFLSEKGKCPLAGVTSPGQLMAILDQEDEILSYTQDGAHFYRFRVIRRGESKEILSYKEAAEQKLIEPYFNKAQADLLLAACVDATPETFKDKAFAYRFARYVDMYKESRPEGELAHQFPIVKMHKSLVRSEPSFISIDQALQMAPGAYSPIQVDSEEGAFVFRFIEKQSEPTLPLDKLVQAQELISKETRSRYFEELIPLLKL